MEKEILGIISTALGLFSLGLYIFSVFYRNAKPHYYTWLIWSLLMGIAFFAQLSDGAGAGAWVIGVSALGCFIIAVLGYFKGEKNITKSDKMALFFGLMAIPLWQITKEPLWSVILVSVIDLVGFYPTFRKSWTKPYEEPLMTYFLALITMLISIFALENTTITTALYPSTLVASNAFFIIMSLWRRKVLK